MGMGRWCPEDTWEWKLWRGGVSSCIRENLIKQFACRGGKCWRGFLYTWKHAEGWIWKWRSEKNNPQRIIHNDYPATMAKRDTEIACYPDGPWKVSRTGWDVWEHHQGRSDKLHHGRFIGNLLSPCNGQCWVTFTQHQISQEPTTHPTPSARIMAHTSRFELITGYRPKLISNKISPLCHGVVHKLHSSIIFIIYSLSLSLGGIIIDQHQLYTPPQKQLKHLFSIL